MTKALPILIGSAFFLSGRFQTLACTVCMGVRVFLCGAGKEYSFQKQVVSSGFILIFAMSVKG
ncbi:hypothetical protein [uncultured Bacteroides sp.]|uniref:hypothetical protein n=1 Tax=uncultured Bacteroides sp. TaxID=162156 RepID=UPI00261B5143|nr:hypothetical protein [uncultured Bacteroides sp.]